MLFLWLWEFEGVRSDTGTCKNIEVCPLQNPAWKDLYAYKGGSLMSAVVGKVTAWRLLPHVVWGLFLLFFSPVSTNALQLTWFFFDLVLLSLSVIFISWAKLLHPFYCSTLTTGEQLDSRSLFLQPGIICHSAEQCCRQAFLWPLLRQQEGGTETCNWWQTGGYCKLSWGMIIGFIQMFLKKLYGDLF